MTGRTRVYIAGSTGSIGTQAVEVIRSAPERFEVVGLAAGSSVGALAAQVAELRPPRVAIADSSKAEQLRALLPDGTDVTTGAEGLASLVEDADVVLNAVVGFAGLPVTIAALRAGARLALANKESLVAGGAVVQEVWHTTGSELVPVDSEHCALHQCLALAGSGSGRINRLLVTASGGPFRGRSYQELAEVTVEQALDHPTWRMGPMNTVNSSTLMNKGLEVIEAHLLFGVPYGHIDVVVHPQSVVHSMVEFVDGSTLAQLSMPDMRLPIRYALSYPERLGPPLGPIDWRTLGRLDFEAPDRQAFPCLDLAYQAGDTGGTAPTCLNAVNEVAVEAFLTGRLRWVDIPKVISETLDMFMPTKPRDIDDVLDADAESRALAREVLERFGAPAPPGGPRA